MCEEKLVGEALKRNLGWFKESGIMVPSDGLWGVAERIAVTADNSSIEKIYASFPAWTEGGDHSVIEQRRPDCNFETALMFLMAGEIFPNDGDAEVAENILDFLYFRSGLLARTDGDSSPLGAWNWSHIKWNPSIWFDDNGWNCVIQFLIAKRYPELDAKYDMSGWAMKCAESLFEGFERTFEDYQGDELEEMRDPKGVWLGDLQLPHWGALVAMALALAGEKSGDAKFADAAKRYFEKVWSMREKFIVSEDAYALIGSAFIANRSGDSFFAEVAAYFADKIAAKMDPETGNIPAEHREAPTGAHLADMIYTVNWALLGMSMMKEASDKYKEAYERLLKLTLDIQDKAPEKCFSGCWRGMYDLKAGEWGGGDCYEGGAGSIYSGWTNAPISWVLECELLSKKFGS
ncbi:MAG: hypothetical protein KAG97_05970 [Victivallales bacterium]|nr:hypothetical protein [Victivallales bacterium]